MVLLLHRVSDIDEFAVFEDEEVVLCREGVETGDGFVAEVGKDVDVSLDHGYMRSQTYTKSNENMFSYYYTVFRKVSRGLRTIGQVE